MSTSAGTTTAIDRLKQCKIVSRAKVGTVKCNTEIKQEIKPCKEQVNPEASG